MGNCDSKENNNYHNKKTKLLNNKKYIGKSKNYDEYQKSIKI